ncbi:IS110 family transposase [Pseudodesulfovibrio sp.]|nr:IS110 family transposase [Pseudodesulfovibrio sp.]
MAKYSLSRISSFLEAFEGEEIHVGIDVHKLSYSVAIRRSDGACDTWVAPAKPYELVHTFLEFGTPIGCIAYEAGPTGFALARALEEAGLTCIVAAPNKIPRPVSPGSKTDRLDCIKLADYAAKGMLKSIAIPTSQEEAERSLLRRRFQLVDELKRTKLRIKSLLLVMGVDEPAGLAKWSKGSVQDLSVIQLEPVAKLTLDSHLRELKWVQQELCEVMVSLRGLAESERHKEAMNRIMSIVGVGITVALAFRLELFRPERFNRQEEVTSYLGLSPTVRYSGDKSPRGRLVPVGQKRLRSLLVEAAWMWQGKVPEVKARYNQLLSRTGIPQKAIAAIARRLAVALWRLSLPVRQFQTT